MVRLFPEQAAPPPLASPAVGAEEVFVHEGEPARELLLLHAPQAPPLAQLRRTVPPPHRFLLRQRRWKRRGRLLRAGGRNRVIVAFFALLWSILLRIRRPRPPRRSRPGRRRLLPSRSLGGDLGGRWRAFRSDTLHLRSPCKRKRTRPVKTEAAFGFLIYIKYI
ncbi:unnamed protein product [Musa acuminata subsp. burmannicoides]